MAKKIEILDCSINLNSLTLADAAPSDIEKFDEASKTFIPYKLTDEIKEWLRSVRTIYSRCWYPFRGTTVFKTFENPAFGKKDITEEDFFFVMQTIVKKIKNKYMRTPDKENAFMHWFDDYCVDSINLCTSVFKQDGFIDMYIGS